MAFEKDLSLSGIKKISIGIKQNLLVDFDDATKNNHSVVDLYENDKNIYTLSNVSDINFTSDLVINDVNKNYDKTLTFSLPNSIYVDNYLNDNDLVNYNNEYVIVITTMNDVDYIVGVEFGFKLTNYKILINDSKNSIELSYESIDAYRPLLCDYYDLVENMECSGYANNGLKKIEISNINPNDSEEIFYSDDNIIQNLYKNDFINVEFEGGELTINKEIDRFVIDFNFSLYNIEDVNYFDDIDNNFLDYFENYIYIIDNNYNEYYLNILESSRLIDYGKDYNESYSISFNNNNDGVYRCQL